MSYSPKIKESLVRRLYKLKHSTAEKPPMTGLVNEAVEEYLQKKERKSENRENNRNNKRDERGNH